MHGVALSICIIGPSTLLIFVGSFALLLLVLLVLLASPKHFQMSCLLCQHLFSLPDETSRALVLDFVL